MKTPLQMMEDISAQIIEAGSLLEVIYRDINDDPEKECAIACLLRSLSVTEEKAHTYAKQLNEKACMNNEASNTTVATSITPAPTFGPFFYPTTSTIGDRIREMRKLRGLKQLQIAEAVNVSPQAVSLWEGGAVPASDKIIPLANALRCDPIWLLTGQDNAGQPADALSHASLQR